jgi:hypothetical protein
MFTVESKTHIMYKDAVMEYWAAASQFHNFYIQISVARLLFLK